MESQIWRRRSIKERPRRKLSKLRKRQQRFLRLGISKRCERVDCASEDRHKANTDLTVLAFPEACDLSLFHYNLSKQLLYTVSQYPNLAALQAAARPVRFNLQPNGNSCDKNAGVSRKTEGSHRPPGQALNPPCTFLACQNPRIGQNSASTVPVTQDGAHDGPMRGPTKMQRTARSALSWIRGG